MNRFTTSVFAVAGAAVLALGAGLAVQPSDKDKKAPAPAAKSPAPAAKADKRVGDAYALDTCPISGKKLGDMGEPVVKVYDGREVRFCCDGCPASFEKDKAAAWAKIDEKIVKDQLPMYPTDKSVVSGKPLGEKPVNFVFGNRLVRLSDEAEKADYGKDPAKYLGELDKAAIAKQAKDYPSQTCFISNEKLGEMGEPVNVVTAGRLIRLCCNGCKKDLDKEPAKFIAKVDAARKGGAKGDEPAHQPPKPAK